MRMRTALDARAQRVAALVVAMGFAALLAACTGSTGSSGAAGPAGPPGPPGPTGPSGNTAIVVTDPSVTSITGTISSVTIGSPPVVKFSLADQNGTPLKGLPASSISFAIAKLTPGVNGGSSTWQSYLYKSVTASGCPTGATSCLTTTANQATTESGTSGTLVDNGDGTYQYTFKTDITTVAGVTYDATLTHRVGFEIRGLAQANNGSYTFQPSTGATTGIFSREIIELQTCNGCHTQLMLHGGARVETQYCVICHNPSTTDPYTGNPLDFKQMIHKIHQGNSLASIQTPPGLALTGMSSFHAGSNITPTLAQGYWIVGYMKSLNNFNTVLFPQDTRNCTTCHNQNLPAATEAANYKTVPTIEACGACHDTTTFSGAAPTHTGGAQTDATCTTCHANTALAQWEVVNVHQIPDSVAASHYQFNVNSVTFSVQAGSTYPLVNISVTDPTNNSQPYNILTHPTFVGNGLLAGVGYQGLPPPTVGTAPAAPVCTESARLALDIGWDTSDYTNWGSATLTFTAALAAGATSGTLSAAWSNPTGSYLVTFSDGESDSVTLTNGATTATWSTALANAVTANANVATPSNWGQPVSVNPLVPGAGGVPAGCSASTLSYGGTTIPVPPALPAPSTLYGPLANGSFTIVGTALPTPPAVDCPPGSSTPCAPIQNVVAVLEGHPGVVTTTVSSGYASADSVGVTTAIGYGNTTGAAPVPRRTVVDIAKCDVCHNALQLHGNNRNDNVQACVVCHNPASTDVSERGGLKAPGVDGLWEQSINFRFMIHAIHDAGGPNGRAAAGVPTVIYSYGVYFPPFGLPPSDFSQVVFPGQLNDCAMCHNSGTYYPVDPAVVLATTFDTGLSPNPAIPAAPAPGSPGNPISTSANMTVCSACHFDSTAAAHMMQMGGSTTVLKDAEGRTVPGATQETCTICHGPGAVADLAVVHNIPVADR